MDLKALQKNWDRFAETDPLFAVVSWPEKRGGRWGEKEFFENGRDEVRGVMGYLRSLRARPRRGRALDFGCGVGRVTRALAPLFKVVTGVDISERMVGLARRYNRRLRNCRFLQHASPDLRPFKSGTFHFIYSSLTLQHMEPRYALSYIREFVRVLAPGGIAVFQLPASHRPRTMAGRVKALLKGVLPGFLRAPYRICQESVLGRPVVEMHTVPKTRVIQALQQAGARVLGVRADPNAGPEWPGYRYCAVKLP